MSYPELANEINGLLKTQRNRQGSAAPDTHLHQTELRKRKHSPDALGDCENRSCSPLRLTPPAHRLPSGRKGRDFLFFRCATSGSSQDDCVVDGSPGTGTKTQKLATGLVKLTSSSRFLPRVANGPVCRLVFGPSALAGSYSEMRQEVPPLPKRGKTESRSCQSKEGGDSHRARGRAVLEWEGHQGFTESLCRSPRPGRSRPLLLPALLAPPRRPPAMKSPGGPGRDTDAPRRSESH
ncbi:uncharacterized protein LOC120584028 [Pteropus medius]|uniref:uncharacterized protein LOC120584028 n=1 Tax=Pteropus vampyrus TaxID=132908 RepID=UPI00196B01D5|nr:uncharacterized protein LOC120584028 [Pteropus giganteus]